MFCEKCGNNLPINAKFCNKCGYHISDLETPANNNQIEQNKKANKHNIRVVIIVLAVILLPIIGISIYDEISNNADSKKDSVDFSTANKETWKEYNSLIGEFKVLFPTLPSHETEDYKIPNTNLNLKIDQFISTQEDETAYLVGFMKFPEDSDFSNTKGILEGSLNGSLQNIEGGKIISSSFSKFNNFDAIDYVLSSPKENMDVKGKNFVIEKGLYMLAMVYEQKNSTNAQFEKFINSFNLTAKSSTKTSEIKQKETDSIDPVEEADYSEGYKSGYVDGRSSYGQLGDNYAEPATEERKSAYFVGYLIGFLKGCREGNFNCSEVEKAIDELYKEPDSNVDLIPDGTI